MGLSKFFLNTGEALRPVLTKIIPMKLLSKMKAGIINNATDKLSADSIEKYEAGRYKCGANIIGNIKGDNGLGQSARIMCRLLDENKEPHVIRDFFVPPGGSRSNDTYDDRLTEELPFDVNIIHVNASEFMVAYLSLGKEVWDYRYNIGYWAWELETFPEEWLPAFKLVDEVCLYTIFAQSVHCRLTDFVFRQFCYKVSIMTVVGTADSNVSLTATIYYIKRIGLYETSVAWSGQSQHNLT